jgi:hypothetical protein
MMHHPSSHARAIPGADTCRQRDGRDEPETGRVIEMTPFMKHLRMEFIEGAEGYAKLAIATGRELGAGAARRPSSLIDDRRDGCLDDSRIATPKYFGSTKSASTSTISPGR